MSTCFCLHTRQPVRIDPAFYFLVFNPLCFPTFPEYTVNLSAFPLSFPG
jgi:hypothetical protein